MDLNRWNVAPANAAKEERRPFLTWLIVAALVIAAGVGLLLAERALRPADGWGRTRLGGLWKQWFGAKGTEMQTPKSTPPPKPTDAPRPPQPALPTVVADARIVVLKGERVVILYSGGVEVRRYPCIIGGNPAGTKEREGDLRTPEGDYTICVKNPNSKYHRSLGLNYPNEQDAARGLRLGIINRQQHDEIVAALRARKRPPWNTPMGGEIFIHGRGTGRDTTLGCVALANADI